jgi:hypothetical protein
MISKYFYLKLTAIGGPANMNLLIEGIMVLGFILIGILLIYYLNKKELL